MIPRLSLGDRPTAATPTTAQHLVLDIEGMKCAGCVQAVEKHLTQQPGVLAATVNLITQKADVQLEGTLATPEHLVAGLTDLGFPSRVYQAQPLTMEATGDRPLAWSQLRAVLFAAVLVGLSAVGHLGEIFPITLPVVGTLWFHAGLATVALVGPGRKMLVDGSKSLWHGLPNMNTLVSLGAITAYGASGIALLWPALNWDCFFDAPVMIVGLILLGRTLEEQARGRATSALKQLVALQPAIARFIPHPAQLPLVYQSIPVAQVQVGQSLQVLPGDRFPVDGVLRQGETIVDESMLTGESQPIAKYPDSEVIAGTLNQSHAVVMTATRTGQETAIAQIIRVVEAAQARKAPIQRFADLVAGYFTYGVMAIAALTFGFWATLGTHLWPEVLHQATPSLHHMGSTFTSGHAGILLSLKLAIAVLVVACPCALGLATPTAVVVGTSLGAEQGLLIRGGDVLEAVHHLDTLVFDKTGTLTTGQPQVTDYWLSSNAMDWASPEQLIQLVASLEAQTRHPFAIALQNKAQERAVELLPVTDSLTHVGVGVSGQIDDHPVLAGKADWLLQQGIAIPEGDRLRADALAQKGNSLIFVARQGTYMGCIALADPLRPDAGQTIYTLQQQGLRVMMMTGDQPTTAIAIGQQLGLDPADIHAGILPTAKAQRIQDLQSQGCRVGMIGDGINDAPALSQADVGIALSSGTDIAIEAAQIVLTRSHLTQTPPQLMDVVRALHLSRQTFRTIQQNLFWAFAYNLVGIPLAAGLLLPAFGTLLDPAAAAALMAFSSVSVVTNALRLRRKGQLIKH